MNLESLKIKNFKGVENLELIFNDKVTRFVGVNGSGKTTIFEGIWATFKGIAENDKGGNIIGDRTYYIGKHGSTSNLEVICRDGSHKVIVTNIISKTGNRIEFKDQDGNVITDDWVKNLLNVALMNATQFCRLNPMEQAKRLGIDIGKFEHDIIILKDEYSQINAILRSLGQLTDIEPTERIDIDKLITKKDKIRKKLGEMYQKNKASNNELRKKYEKDQSDCDMEIEVFNDNQIKARQNIDSAKSALEVLTDVGYNGNEVTEFIDSLPKPEKIKAPMKLPEPEYIEEMPDDSELNEIDKQMTEAHEINQRAVLYEQYLKSKELKYKQELKLADNKFHQEEIQKQKLDYIKSFNFGFEGLTVSDEGGLLLDGRIIDSYSQAEKEIIVARLATSLNPDFKVRIIDEFQSFDENNQQKVINELLEAGYQILIAEVGKVKRTDDTVLLKECKIVEGYESKQKKLI